MMKNEAGVRIEEMLCQLADATRIDGEIWRAAYTLEDKIAKNILREWIEDLGLEYREDAIGNVYGRLPGTEESVFLPHIYREKILMTGKTIKAELHFSSETKARVSPTRRQKRPTA